MKTKQGFLGKLEQAKIVVDREVVLKREENKCLRIIGVHDALAATAIFNGRGVHATVSLQAYSSKQRTIKCKCEYLRKHKRRTVAYLYTQ